MAIVRLPLLAPPPWAQHTTPNEEAVRKRLTAAYKSVCKKSKDYATFACGRVASKHIVQNGKGRHKGSCLTKKPMKCKRRR